jgi:hypothetical protein
MDSGSPRRGEPVDFGAVPYFCTRASANTAWLPLKNGDDAST